MTVKNSIQKLFPALLLFTFTALQILLHFLRSELSPLNSFVSNYGVGKFSSIFSLSLIPLAISTFFLGWKFLKKSLQCNSKTPGFLLLISAVATIFVAIFPTNIGQETSTHGTIHAIAAYTSFIFTCISYLLLIKPLKSFGFAFLAISNLVLLLALYFVNQDIQGLFERLVLVSIVINSVYLHYLAK